MVLWTATFGRFLRNDLNSSNLYGTDEDKRLRSLRVGQICTDKPRALAFNKFQVDPWGSIGFDFKTDKIDKRLWRTRPARQHTFKLDYLDQSNLRSSASDTIVEAFV